MDQMKVFFHCHGYTLIALVAVLIFFLYPNVGIYDWDKEIMYCDFIRQSILIEGEFPGFMWNREGYLTYPAVAQSAYFIGNPETFLFSPFVPLLLVLPSAIFLKALVVIHFIIGWLGIKRLGSTCGWNENQTRIFSLLFTLSQIVFQHIAIGYLPWINLFFIPWLYYFLIQRAFIKRSIGTGLVLTMMLLQGGLHVFIWSGFFTALFFLIRFLIDKKFNNIFSLSVIGVTTAILSLPRLIPSYQTFGSFEQRIFNGYSIHGFLRWAFIPPFFTPQRMDDIEFFIENHIDGVPFWDGNLFWGFLLICALLLPYLLWTLHKKKDDIFQEKERVNIVAFSAACFLILLLSFGGVYEGLISPISDLLKIPALKGMEKYPFRFAIPAYFGFAFTTAWMWEAYLDLFNRIFQFHKKVFHQAWRQLLKWTENLSKRKKLFSRITGPLVLLIFLLFVFHTQISKWIMDVVALAYYSEGTGIITSQMEHSDVVPLNLYQSKALTLYKRFNRVLLLLTFIFCGLRLFILNRKDKEPKIKRVHKGTGDLHRWIPELFLFLPMIIAFGMWWRVALATPIENFQEYINRPPAVQWENKNSNLELPEITSNSTSIEITVYEEMVGQTLVFPEVAFSDLRFMEIERTGIHFKNLNGTTALELPNIGLIKIKILFYPIFLLTIITAIGWIALAWTIHRKKEK